jgi:hypothetical protein
VDIHLPVAIDCLMKKSMVDHYNVMELEDSDSRDGVMHHLCLVLDG